MNRKWPASVLLPVSWGEVFDKLTILEIKAERLIRREQLDNVNREMREIEAIVGDVEVYPAELRGLIDRLKVVNCKLWDIEEGKRKCEKELDFGAGFVALARQVYFGNDERASIKREINHLLGSALVEEKSHSTVKE